MATEGCRGATSATPDKLYGQATFGGVAGQSPLPTNPFNVSTLSSIAESLLSALSNTMISDDQCKKHFNECESRRNSAQEVLDEVKNHADDDVKAAVKEATAGHGADIVVDHVGEATWRTSLDVAASGQASTLRIV